MNIFFIIFAFSIIVISNILNVKKTNSKNFYDFNKNIEENYSEYVESALNNMEYEVQDYENKEIAADMLASLKKNINKITIHLEQKYPNLEKVKRFSRRIKTTKIEEAVHEEGESSYTINKGELMAICLRKKNKDKDFHQMNLLMFVVIHELAHIMSLSEGHNTEFMENFKFLLKEATAVGVYKPVDFAVNPVNYCGVHVSHNPYFSGG